MSKTGTETLTNKTLTSPTINVGGDTIGDILVRDTGGSITRIVAGGIGQYLISQGSGVKPAFSSPTSDTTLVGIVTAYAGATAPTGYALCNGQALSRSTYASLFAIVSTIYGVGDGSTTFNVPNLQNNVAVGKGSAPFATLGNTGGEQTHVLITSEMPSHTHNISTATFNGGASPFNEMQGATTAGTGTWSKNTGLTGGDIAHNNLQPYLVLNYIIKII